MFDKLKLWFKSDVIEFYCHPNFEGVLPTPIQASKVIPDWWKTLPQTSPQKDHFGSESMTAKKCMPLLDVMTLGNFLSEDGEIMGRKATGLCTKCQRKVLFNIYYII